MAALQQETFDVWREQDSDFKRQVLEHIQQSNAKDVQNEGRFATIETRQENYEKRGATITAIVSATVSSIIGGIAGAVFGAR